MRSTQREYQVEGGARTERSDGPVPQDLLDACGEVGQVGSVVERREAFAARDGIEFLLGLLLLLRVRAHEKNECGQTAYALAIRCC